MTETTQTSVTPSPGTETPAERRATRTPRFEIRDHAERLTLTAEMPGVAADAVEVTLENEVLRVRGHVAPRTPEGQRQQHTEFEPADFEAAFGVREDLDADAIRATLRNGLLRVELPKRVPAQRTIPVTAG